MEPRRIKRECHNFLGYMCVVLFDGEVYFLEKFVVFVECWLMFFFLSIVHQQ